MDPQKPVEFPGSKPLPPIGSTSGSQEGDKKSSETDKSRRDDDDRSSWMSTSKQEENVGGKDEANGEEKDKKQGKEQGKENVTEKEAFDIDYPPWKYRTSTTAFHRPGEGSARPAVTRGFRPEVISDDDMDDEDSPGVETVRRKTYDGRELVFVSLDTQTDWDWVEAIEEQIGTAHTFGSEGGEREDKDRATASPKSAGGKQEGADESEQYQYQMPYNDEYGIPILDLSSDTDDSSDEEVSHKKHKDSRKFIPSVGPPNILQISKEGKAILMGSPSAANRQLQKTPATKDAPQKVPIYTASTRRPSINSQFLRLREHSTSKLVGRTGSNRRFSIILPSIIIPSGLSSVTVTKKELERRASGTSQDKGTARVESPVKRQGTPTASSGFHSGKEEPLYNGKKEALLNPYQRESEKHEISADDPEARLEGEMFDKDEDGMTHGMFSGKCEFCHQDIKPFPTQEQQEKLPPESLYCCDEYRDFVDFVFLTANEMEEDIKRKNKLINIKPHEHVGSKQERNAAKEKAVQRMRERELQRRQQEASGLQQNFFASEGGKGKLMFNKVALGIGTFTMKDMYGAEDTPEKTPGHGKHGRKKSHVAPGEPGSLGESGPQGATGASGPHGARASRAAGAQGGPKGAHSGPTVPDISPLEDIPMAKLQPDNIECFHGCPAKVPPDPSDLTDPTEMTRVRISKGVNKWESLGTNSGRETEEGDRASSPGANPLNPLPVLPSLGSQPGNRGGEQQHGCEGGRVKSGANVSPMNRTKVQLRPLAKSPESVEGRKSQVNRRSSASPSPTNQTPRSPSPSHKLTPMSSGRVKEGGSLGVKEGIEAMGLVQVLREGKDFIEVEVPTAHMVGRRGGLFHSHECDIFQTAQIGANLFESFTEFVDEVARQMKTINYQLSSQKCLEEGWTLRAPSPLLEDLGDDVFVPEPLHPEMLENGKEDKPLAYRPDSAALVKLLRERPLIEKYYESGQKFLTMFPDGTGNVFYPSGNLAILISSVKLGQYFYTIHQDVKRSPVVAVFEPNGYGYCYFPNGAVRMYIDQYGGIELDTSGGKRRKWSWKDQVTHIHAPPFQPICIGLNRHMGVRVMSQENIALTFSASQRSCRFNMGARLKIVAPENAPLKEIEENHIFLEEKKNQVDAILDKVSNLLKFPNHPKLEKMLPPLHIVSKATKTEKMKKDRQTFLAQQSAREKKQAPVQVN